MPIYEYQGQQYEMSTTDPQEAKNKMIYVLDIKNVNDEKIMQIT